MVSLFPFGRHSIKKIASCVIFVLIWTGSLPGVAGVVRPLCESGSVHEMVKSHSPRNFFKKLKIPKKKG
jgi:hypothetical protein